MSTIRSQHLDQGSTGQIVNQSALDRWSALLVETSSQTSLTEIFDQINSEAADGSLPLDAAVAAVRDQRDKA